ncbi:MULTISPECIES: HpcH/HpaI aldolase/citrate lyase family protein [Vitreoscilla]|uniref:HpcH/HpaI aldolase/citrate lyase family protein n=1 Tax=Vitreoscilla stercoraria TaxID=61 RepID=A0ABY4EAW1_VITST|nr:MULTISPECIES: HpcH/HpaI aldolase/citrate lyase family protein [Vitreoscilla]AUZ05715.1 hypothetical protein ADP71_23560 [Vitreoscilla sp. C1]UOO92889.1 HpcH/HpaI aldolase/citrate lyase family protein [Vitreoscilla stercoraria]
MLKPHQYCASLYVPTTHKDLNEIMRGEKLQEVGSLIFCTEDAVSEQHLPQAISRFLDALPYLNPHSSQQRFVRVRNPAVMQQLLANEHIQNIDGFVLPKITAKNIGDYQILVEQGFYVMPTLETAEVFIEQEMLQLRDILLQPLWRPYVLSLRLGGNDLLNLLSMRRSAEHTVYETVLGTHIDRLVGWFKPCGFELSAPVFEFLNQPEVLMREVQADLLHGLTGKTAIHPTQIASIEAFYAVKEQDVLVAKAVLASNQAVFQYQQCMQEVATHYRWAQKTLTMAGLS